MRGRVISGYLIEGLLAEGGMGQVYKAVHQQLDRPAAIKVLHPHFVKDAQTVARFIQEARAVNLIRHRGLVDIFEIGQLPDGRPFFIMEYLEGETLLGRLSRAGSLPEWHALRVVRQMATALCAAHAQHIAHRDLKPENVMLVPDPELPDGERVKILDFGIAKFLTGPETERRDGARAIRTASHQLLGTPQYMAPELWSGTGQATELVDVYAMGVMLYEMLVGRVPFEGELPPQVMMQHLTAEPGSLPAALLISEDTSQMLTRMLAKEPAQRPTMADIASQLAARAPSLTSLPGLSTGSGIVQAQVLAAAVGMGSGPGILPAAPSAVGPSSNPQVPPAAAVAPPAPVPAGAAGAPVIATPARSATHATDPTGPLVLWEPASAIHGQTIERTPSGAWSSLRGWPGRALLFALFGAGATAAIFFLVVPPRPEDTRPDPAVPPTVAAPQRAPSSLPPPGAGARSRVRWVVRSIPSGAQVFEAATGAAVGKTPWQHEVAARPGQHELVLRLPGYTERHLVLAGNTDEDREERLQAAAQAIDPRPQIDARGRPEHPRRPDGAGPQRRGSRTRSQGSKPHEVRGGKGGR